MAKKTSKEESRTDAPRKVDAIMHIRVFRPVVTRIGGIVVKAYEPVDEMESIDRIEVRTRKDAVDAIFNKLMKDRQEILKRYKNLLVEINVEGKGFALTLGESTEEEEGLRPDLIFPRPARLLRIGVLKEGQIKWTRPRRGVQYYVFEGIVEIPRDADAVIIETDKGTRVIKKPPAQVQ